MGHGIAHLLIGKKRIGSVHIPADITERPLGVPSLVSDFAERFGVCFPSKLLGTERPDHIDILLFERKQGDVLVGYDPKDDTFKIRFLALVIFPAFDNNFIVLFPFDQAVRTIANRLTALLIVVITSF